MKSKEDVGRKYFLADIKKDVGLMWHLVSYEETVGWRWYLIDSKVGVNRDGTCWRVWKVKVEVLPVLPGIEPGCIVFPSHKNNV